MSEEERQALINEFTETMDAAHMPPEVRGAAAERERLLADPELYRRLRESWLVKRMG